MLESGSEQTVPRLNGMLSLPHGSEPSVLCTEHQNPVGHSDGVLLFGNERACGCRAPPSPPGGYVAANAAACLQLAKADFASSSRRVREGHPECGGYYQRCSMGMGRSRRILLSRDRFLRRGVMSGAQHPSYCSAVSNCDGNRCRFRDQGAISLDWGRSCFILLNFPPPGAFPPRKSKHKPLQGFQSKINAVSRVHSKDCTELRE
jgi:hypothetical protein